MQVAPIKDCFEAAADENGIRRHLGEVKKEARDDPQCKAITEALKYVAGIKEIDIVNMSVGSAKKPPGIEDVMPKLLAANKILIASAGEPYQFCILLHPIQPIITPHVSDVMGVIVLTSCVCLCVCVCLLPL